MNTASPTSTTSAAKQHRVLFIAEAVTLAHVARPLTLASALADSPWAIDFACSRQYQPMAEGRNWSLHQVDSIPSAQFIQALSKGSPVYDLATLRGYVEQDLELLAKVKPDLVVGDFRLSLAVSARLAKIPYATISNAYWSPYARPRYQVPELPLTRVLGPTLANPLFRLVRPAAFALHTIPINRLYRHYGLPMPGFNLGRAYTEADYTLYADLPELIPTFELPAQHHYLGPINWAPDNPLPDWWDKLPAGRPIVYVTLGSSGDSERLQAIVDGLATLPLTAIVATAGRSRLNRVPENTHVAEFLPGDQASARAALVICNGGSPTAYQGLAAGAPVIGVCNNLDQYLNMAYLEQAGVGKTVRSGQASAERIRQVAEQLLNDTEASKRATSIANAIRQHPAGERFRQWIATVA